MIRSKPIIMSYLYDSDKKIRGFWQDSLFNVYASIDNFHKKIKLTGNLCEVGIWHGRSIFPLINFLSKDEFLIGVDKHLPNNRIDTFMNYVEECYFRNDNIKLIESESNLGCFNKYGPSRFFRIDGGHSYHYTKNDLNIAFRVTKDEGIILLDDYNHPTYRNDIMTAVNEFLKEKPEMTIAFSSTMNLFICREWMAKDYINLMKHLPNFIETEDTQIKGLKSFNHKSGVNSWLSNQLN